MRDGQLCSLICFLSYLLTMHLSHNRRKMETEILYMRVKAMGMKIITKNCSKILPEIFRILLCFVQSSDSQSHHQEFHFLPVLIVNKVRFSVIQFNGHIVSGQTLSRLSEKFSIWLHVWVRAQCRGYTMSGVHNVEGTQCLLRRTKHFSCI